MDFLLPHTEPEKHSIWDEYVPTIQSGRHVDSYLTDSIEAPAEYNALCHALRKAERYDTFTLHINNGGGYVDSAFMLIDAITHTKAKVTASLTGTIASAATLITLACDSIIVAEHISWLTHNYSSGIQGKGGEMKAQMDFMSKELETSFRSIHEGFLTEEECAKVIDDGDFWFNKSEVLARWASRAANDSEGLAEIAATRKAK